jgi:hypothetical protein
LIRRLGDRPVAERQTAGPQRAHPPGLPLRCIGASRQSRTGSAALQSRPPHPDGTSRRNSCPAGRDAAPCHNCGPALLFPAGTRMRSWEDSTLVRFRGADVCLLPRRAAARDLPSGGPCNFCRASRS